MEKWLSLGIEEVCKMGLENLLLTDSKKVQKNKITVIQGHRSQLKELPMAEVEIVGALKLSNIGL